MVLKVHVKGFEDCINAIDKHENATGGLYLLFSGSKDTETGDSWCPDCVKAEPVIEAALKSAPENAVFIHVEVGDRPFWKDQTNIFRKDERLRLKCVPTLLKFNTPQRLEEEQLFDIEVIKMLFED